MPQSMSQPSKIIFLPGAGGNPAFWEPASDMVQHPASRRLLGWPGFGVIPPDPEISTFDDLVALVIRELDQPSALVAQSMGGIIALLAALKRPDRVTHIVLSVTSGGVDMSDLHATDWRPEFIGNNPGLPRWFTDYAGDISASLPSIQAPVLLLWGDADPISPVAMGERLLGLFPNSQLVVIPGGEHDLAWKRASEIAPLIGQHLALASSVQAAPGEMRNGKTLTVTGQQR